MINEEKVINTLSIITETCLNDLNDFEKILVISNLLLMESEKYLPEEIKKDSKQILSNGKRINYESLKYETNLGLSLATKAHVIIDEMHKHLEQFGE